MGTNASGRSFATRFFLLALSFSVLLRVVPGPAAERAVTQLKVSDNHRFLMYEDGRPFFYLADTAWELFHKLNRDEASFYLQNRARKQFTVVQAVVLAELDGLHSANAYGHIPLLNDDPRSPVEEYFKHVDFIVREANRLGIYVGMLPTWGDKWNKARGAGPEIFTPENAETYGEFLGQRYKNAGVIWILGGDRPVESDQQKEIIRRMARGLRRGDDGQHLITFHPQGGKGSSTWFHEEPWLDFNMRQNGHDINYTGRYDQTRVDYDRLPVKPVVDGEPVYEDHPVSFDASRLGYTTAADVRRALYWDLFAGACGHTYGNHAVWQMYDPKKSKGVNSPLMSWREALDQPGAGQMQFARKLLEDRKYLSRVPDDSLIAADSVATAVPGAGTRRFVATRDLSGSYALIYTPIGRSFQVRLDRIQGKRVKAWWFNPRDGSRQRVGTYSTVGTQRFIPPTPGELLDWILLIEAER